jgi:RNA polymerase sigma-70 factor (ECF subfamily)
MSTEQQSHVFERVVRPHFDRLYRLAWRLAGNKSEAEDLFQELLIKAYGKLDELVTIEEPGSWLSRVMYNLFVDRKRRFSRERLRLVDEGQLPPEGVASFAGEHNPATDHERYERIQQLDAALAQLSDEHRIVVLLHDTEGYKLEEIHKLTGVPVGTIKSRLHRARARLREILVADGTLSASASCREQAGTKP